MYSQILFVLPLLSTLLVTTTASPVNSHSTSDTKATMTCYYVNPSCNSPYNKSNERIRANECINLGEGATTRSIGFTMDSTPQGKNCKVKVWNDWSCSQGPGKDMEVGVGGSSTCIDGKAIGHMLSAMLVC